ncbi:unnamed protein product [Spodoptera littoralis]|uniref:Galectin n=1 Tax=Spodoptera littoralis TaxID=7109 RepID=A0A9P0I5R0_SPOLI|nr:unnamed protein product [Spodoptera littoralis]CAH1641946.1 unnamed protein product [Spodoptera littoralis]
MRINSQVLEMRRGREHILRCDVASQFCVRALSILFKGTSPPQPPKTAATPVALNRKHFCEFFHRLPFHTITHVMVEGDVIIQQIAFEGPPPAQQENVKVLCVQPIPGGMFPGRVIKVKGSTPPKAKRFSINLKCGTKGFPRDDIAFHFNPRFDMKHIVRNHFDSSIESWGDEETGGGLPLHSGECFEALIQCYYDCFKAEAKRPEASNSSQLKRSRTNACVFKSIRAHSLTSSREVRRRSLSNSGRIPTVDDDDDDDDNDETVKRADGPPDVESTLAFQRDFPRPIFCNTNLTNSRQVALNDAHFCEFSHRIPYHKVSHIMIKGDVILQQITIEGTLLQQVNMLIVME